MRAVELFEGAALLALLAGAAQATMIRGGDGSGNTTAPADDPGWANVGRLSGANSLGSAVYLSNRWVLTAAHVGEGDPEFGGTAYLREVGTTQRLTEPGGGSDVDIVLFRITEVPTGVSDLTVSSSSPSLHSSVTGVGFSRNRAASETDWYVDTDPATWVWSESSFPEYDVILDGFEYEVGRALRWGENEVDATGVLINAGWGPTLAIEHDFDKTGGAGDDEFQGATGDSGGALFWKNGGDWELAGMMMTTGRYSGQPGLTAVYGNTTYSADLAQYHDQIYAIIPEPAAGTLLAGILALAVRRRRSPPRR